MPSKKQSKKLRRITQRGDAFKFGKLGAASPVRHIDPKTGEVIKPQPTKPVNPVKNKNRGGRAAGRRNDRTLPMMDADRSDVFQVVEIEPGNWAVKKGSVTVRSGMSNAQAWDFADRKRRFRSWERDRKMER